MKLPRGLTPQRIIHLFVAANIGFLGLDIGIAHMANDYARRVEWAPIVFSALATPVLLPAALGSRSPVFRILDRVVGWAAILVGVAGMVFHLQSGFFGRQTLHHLVYSAPFVVVAPLSYVGVGLLLLLLRSAEVSRPTFGRGCSCSPWGATSGSRCSIMPRTASSMRASGSRSPRRRSPSGSSP